VNKQTMCLADARAHKQWWPRYELSHFHRIGSVLWSAGLRVETDSGVTDEGEPWFGFFDIESGEVVAHFARISCKYVVCASFLNGPLTGSVLSDLVARFLDRCPGGAWRPTTAAPHLARDHASKRRDSRRRLPSKDGALDLDRRWPAGQLKPRSPQGGAL
jgi:hypothetical protein